MTNKLVKYEGNFFSKFFSNIKNIFTRKKISSFPTNEPKLDIQPEKKLEKKPEVVVPKIKLEDVLIKFETVGKDKLSSDETEQLIKYYENKNIELEREILYKQTVLNSLNKKLNSYYETAIKLKEAQG